MKLNNKGFSLVELLAVLVILATILLIALPSISSSLNRSEEQDLENRKQIILSEAELKLSDDQLTTIRGGGKLTTDQLLTSGIITEDQSKDKDGNKIDICIGYNTDKELDIVNCT